MSKGTKENGGNERLCCGQGKNYAHLRTRDPHAVKPLLVFRPRLGAVVRNENKLFAPRPQHGDRLCYVWKLVRAGP